jgi:hypothetical protein
MSYFNPNIKEVEQSGININIDNGNNVNEDAGIGIKLISSKMAKIDKIVYSLWTKPNKDKGTILEHAVNWYSPKAHLMSLALSVNKSAEHFKEVELVTDSEGWKVISKLNLPFTSVKTILDDIPEAYYGFWSLGKIYAYAAQDKPFVHLDNDAILWDGLPEWAKEADIFVQNTEDKGWFEHSYLPEINHANKVLRHFPPNWGISKEAYCLGIFGGTDLETIQEYTKEALKFVFHKYNKYGWDSIENKGSYCIVFEQYIMTCIAEHRKVDVTYFDKYLDKQKLESYGYTHIWGAKKDKSIEPLLQKSLLKHYPESLINVLKLF